MKTVTIETLKAESEEAFSRDIYWVAAPQRMLDATESLERIAKQLGDTPEATEILSVIGKVEEINAQFVRAFHIAHREACDAETGLGFFLHFLSLDGDAKLVSDEVACLLKPLHRQLQEAIPIIYALGRGV